MEAFPAKYYGHCNACDEYIKPDESIIRHPDAGFIHEGCVEYVGKPSESNGAAFDSFNRGRAPIAVLPRGKTGKDKCNRCFIIHTPGQGDECE